jgi:hypothetical protein
MKEGIKVKHSVMGAYLSKSIEQAQNLINIYGFVLVDDRYTLQGKQIKKAKKKKEDNAE